MVSVIKTEIEYQNALSEIEKYIDQNPEAGSLDANRFELLVVLVKDYETKNVRIGLPDPIEAILFRMEQDNLKQSDLIPYLGSKSKVSEVLSRKRPLSLSMIRALHTGLGIPAEVLLQGQEISENAMELDWSRFPVKEMISRGWITPESNMDNYNDEKLVKEFFLRHRSFDIHSVLYRSSRHIRSTRSMDEYALAAWTARVGMRADEEGKPKVRYNPGVVNIEFMREIVKLSWSETGPKLALEYLSNHGIPLIIEPHMKGTYLDGAALLMKNMQPIIVLTLRHDRLDSFWFSLMHELSHLALHTDRGISSFFDDLDPFPDHDEIEREADAFASEALIPQEEWKRSPASKLKSPQAAEHLAKKLGIHPAIVAGRMRREFKAYQLLSHLLGYRQVRKQFPNIIWDSENA